MEEPIATRRGRRSLRAVNYKDLEKIKLPKVSVCKPKDKLYPVTVLEHDADKVKVHYVGFSEDHDEWREENELEALGEEEDEGTSMACYKSLSIYDTLRLKIKQALTCGRRSSPVINIVMAFDLIQFNGGLKTVGIPSKKVQGVQHYKIRHYHDLNLFLGRNWHYRGLNEAGDYGFVILDTVDFCLRKARSFVEYLPPHLDEKPIKHSVDTGFCVSFCFVHGYGSTTTFGKDKNIFYE